MGNVAGEISRQRWHLSKYLKDCEISGEQDSGQRDQQVQRPWRDDAWGAGDRERGWWGKDSRRQTAVRQENVRFHKWWTMWTSPEPCTSGKQWQLKKNPLLLCSGKEWLTTKSHPSPNDLIRHTDDLLVYLWQRQTDTPNFHSLSHKGLAQLSPQN